MANLTFKKTHRVLQKMSNNNYEMVEIDINSGFFKKVKTEDVQTLIKVNSEIFGEELNILGKSKALNIKQIKALQVLFNNVRATKEFLPVEFRVIKELPLIDQSALPENLKHLLNGVNNDLSSSSEVQGQETTEALQQ